jgi:Na+-translocating ferredoxin:NAD+ oxidoreductase RnfA subunit
LGIGVVLIITGEIRRRSVMEAVPPLFRNGPLALIAMGLLSLIFSSAAMMLYKVLEG